MEKIIVPSRYSEDRILTQIKEKEFQLEAPSMYIRSFDNGDIDFDGGPYLRIGGTLHYFKREDLIIKSIKKEVTSDFYIIEVE
jgi:hypothetical protein